MSWKEVRQAILEQGDAERALQTARFFKTGPGQYGEGDVFCGVSTPQVRRVVKMSTALALDGIRELLHDSVHEVRACGVLLLVARFLKGDEKVRAQVVECYVKETQSINNWDLVDISCGILGIWLRDKDRGLLYQLAQSPNMWEQRMAVVGTLPLIKAGDFSDTLQLTILLMEHPHDLMHKAMGWMLREVGKKDKAVLVEFLEKYVHQLPRTSLRYAIERFEATERKMWLHR